MKSYKKKKILDQNGNTLEGFFKDDTIIEGVGVYI